MRSEGPTPSPSAMRLAAATYAVWDSTAPFGGPVVPEV